MLGIVIGQSSNEEEVAIDTAEAGFGSGRYSAKGAAPAFDQHRFNALIQYDEDVRKAVDQISGLGDRWVGEFASAYLALNDKKYIPNILNKIRDEEEKERLALARQPQVAEEGVLRGWKWRRLNNGEFEAETAKGWRKFPTLQEMQLYLVRHPR